MPTTKLQLQKNKGTPLAGRLTNNTNDLDKIIQN